MKAVKKLISDLFSVEMLMYILFGIGTALIDNLTEIFLYNTLKFRSHALLVVTANTVSFLLSVIFAFVTNKKFVFKTKSESRHHLRMEALKFFLARMLTFIMSLFGMIVLVDKLSLNNEISKFVVSVGVVILNYFFSKLIIFKDKENKE